MYLMMASVCPSVSTLQNHRCANQPRYECQKKADLRWGEVRWWCQVGDGGSSPDSVVWPPAWRMENEASWCVVSGRLQGPHSSLPSTMTVNRLMEKNSLFLSEMGLCHLAHCDFLIQRFFSSCVQNWTFSILVVFYFYCRELSTSPVTLGTLHGGLVIEVMLTKYFYCSNKKYFQAIIGNIFKQ